MPASCPGAANTPKSRRLKYREHGPLAIVLALFVLVASAYNVANPLFEAPDEIWHYLFVKHLVENRELPVQDPTRGEIYRQQEAAQGPVYYVIGAVATAWVKGRPAPEWIRTNEHASIGTPSSEGNKNRFVHGPEEGFPYQGDFLAAHIVRFVSTLFGAGTVLFTYLIARRLWPSRPALALGAASLNAFNPQFLYISAAASNDVPVAFFCSAILWVCVCLVQAGRARVRDVMLLGILAGVAILTKLAALVTVPLVGLGLALVAWRQRRLQFALWSIPIATLFALLVSGWWFIRNFLLYRDWLAMKDFLTRSSYTSDPIPTFAEVVHDLTGLRQSFWGLFGWFSIVVDDRLYAGFDVLLLFAAIGLALALLDPRRRRSLCPLALWPVATLAILVFVALLSYRMIVQAFQGRLLFPAISAFAILIVLGLASLVPRRVAPVLSITLGVALLLVALFIPPLYFTPNYSRPLSVAASDLGTSLKVEAKLGGEVELVAYEVDSESVQAGQLIEVTLYWRALEPIRNDYSVFMHLLDWQGKLIAQKDTFPAGGRNATSLWQPGEIFADVYRLRVPVDVVTPGILRLTTGLYLAQSMERLPVRFADGQEGDQVPLARLRAMGPDTVRIEVQHRVGVSFSDQALLVGYRAPALKVTAGSDYSGELQWRALGSFDKDLTVFVQLIGPAGLVAQDDSQPRGGAFPTSVWLAGDDVPHPFRIQVPVETPPGLYRLIAGLYDSSGRRLQTPAGNYADLGMVSVVERQSP